MTPTVARIMMEIASHMLQHVRRSPFYLSPTSRKEAKRADPEWCAKFEQEVRNQEERYWTEKIKFYQDQIS